MFSQARQQRARNLSMSTLLSVVDYYDTHPIYMPPLDLDGDLLDKLLNNVAFKTAPRVGAGKDTLEFVVGRNVYHALTVMDEYREHLTQVPFFFVKAGSPVLYKGYPVTTDAMLKPGSWMLPPNSIFCVATRRNGNTVVTRPCAIEVDIPCLDEAEILPLYMPTPNS